MTQDVHVQDRQRQAPPREESALATRVRALLRNVDSPDLATDLSAHTEVFAQVDAEIRGALHAGANRGAG